MNPYQECYLHEMPILYAVLRPIECELLNKIQWQTPILDVGCGDGFFSSVAFPDRKLELGIDPNQKSVEIAKQRGNYKEVICTTADKIPYSEASFGSAFANCVMEHIDDDLSALKEISRVLKPKGIFAFGVPSIYFEDMLLGSKLLGKSYKKFFTKICRHKHYRSIDQWQGIIEEVGMRLISSNYYINPCGLRQIELAHYWEFPRILIKKIFGKWVLKPEKRIKKHGLPLANLLKENLEANLESGAYLFIIAQKI